MFPGALALYLYLKDVSGNPPREVSAPECLSDHPDFDPGSPRPTGVKYEDVAGIDAVKDDIKVAMDMLLGAPAFAAAGARPYRVLSRCELSTSRRMIQISKDM